MNRKLKLMKIGGQKLTEIFNILEKMSRPGVNLLEIERKAWFLVERAGGHPSFAKVPGYSHATCLNVNDGLVHGTPKDYQLRHGDLLNIDIGFFYHRYHTDLAKSFIVGKGSDYSQKVKFLEIGKKALEKAIGAAVEGNFIGHISDKIQQIIEKAAFHCAKKYTGHGIGKKLHQPPLVPCILTKEIKKTPPLVDGMTLAIEVIYMRGDKGTKVDKDGWTVRTADGSWAACFEKTVAVGKKKPLILTPW